MVASTELLLYQFESRSAFPCLRFHRKNLFSLFFNRGGVVISRPTSQNPQVLIPFFFFFWRWRVFRASLHESRTNYCSHFHNRFTSLSVRMRWLQEMSTIGTELETWRKNKFQSIRLRLQRPTHVQNLTTEQMFWNQRIIWLLLFSISPVILMYETSWMLLQHKKPNNGCVPSGVYLIYAGLCEVHSDVQQKWPEPS